MYKNIVLVHGWGANVGKLRYLEKKLEKYGWNTFLVKLPGFDLDPPENAWKMDDYVNYVSKQSKKRFGDSKYFIFGHSFGGRVAIKLSKDKQLSKMLHGVILCSSGGISRGNVIKRKFFYFIAKIGKVLIISPWAARSFKKIIYKFAREHDYERTEGVMRQTFQNVIKEDLKGYLGLIRIPALILWGGDDNVTPIRDAYYLESNIKGSTLVEYAGVTHNLPYVEFKRLAKDINEWANNLKI